MFNLAFLIYALKVFLCLCYIVVYLIDSIFQQVLKGDLRGAIKMHATLHQIVKRHDFLPEAVLFDHSPHWAGHPLRPEFLESTYFLYTATRDDHYLAVASRALDQLETHARSPCGYAAIRDVRTKAREDRMDSFVLAELFKYFFLMFAEEGDVGFDLDEFVFTTEAHMLPVRMDAYAYSSGEMDLFTCYQACIVIHYLVSE